MDPFYSSDYLAYLKRHVGWVTDEIQEGLEIAFSVHRRLLLIEEIPCPLLDAIETSQLQQTLNTGIADGHAVYGPIKELTEHLTRDDVPVWLARAAVTMHQQYQQLEAAFAALRLRLQAVIPTAPTTPSSLRG